MGGRSDSTRNSRQGMSSVVEILPVRKTLPVSLPNGQLIPNQTRWEHLALSPHPPRDCKTIEQAGKTYRKIRACKPLRNLWTGSRFRTVEWFWQFWSCSFGAFRSLRPLRTDELPGALKSAGGCRFRLPCSMFLQWESSRTSHCTGTRYIVSYPENFSVGIVSLRKNFKQSTGAFT